MIVINDLIITRLQYHHLTWFYYSFYIFNIGTFNSSDISFDHVTETLDEDGNVILHCTDKAVHGDSSFSSNIDSDDMEARYSNYVANGYETVISSNDNECESGSDNFSGGKYHYKIILLHR